MNKKVLLAVLLSVATAFGVSAQKLSGDLTPLKGQKEVNVALDFSGTLVNGGAEDKYIADETKGKTDEEKKQWLSEWNEKLRSDAFSKLCDDFNTKMGDKFFSIGENKNAEYTINIKVKDITVGAYAGPFSKASAIRSEVSFVKKGETTPFATVEYKNSRSVASSVVPYFVTKVVMSFGSLGDDLSSTISKALK